MYTVYILQTKRGTWYCGYTSNLDQRIKTHISGHGSKYVTSQGGVEQLVHTEEFETKSEAMSKEAYIKSLTRSQKEEYVANFE